MTLEHGSVPYFYTFNGSYIFVKLLDNIFFKHKVEEYLARYKFIKEKRPISIGSRLSQLFIELPS